MAPSGRATSEKTSSRRSSITDTSPTWRTRRASATEACDDAGVVLTSVRRPIPYGAGKVTRLREKLGTRTLYATFGDNVFDIPMLRDARVPVAIRPKPRLVERADEVPGLVVLA